MKCKPYRRMTSATGSNPPRKMEIPPTRSTIQAPHFFFLREEVPQSGRPIDPSHGEGAASSDQSLSSPEKRLRRCIRSHYPTTKLLCPLALKQCERTREIASLKPVVPRTRDSVGQREFLAQIVQTCLSCDDPIKTFPDPKN